MRILKLFTLKLIISDLKEEIKSFFYEFEVFYIEENIDRF